MRASSTENEWTHIADDFEQLCDFTTLHRDGRWEAHWNRLPKKVGL